MIETKTVILHCKKLKERKENILNQMSKFNFTDYDFYEDYDASELSEDDIKHYYEPKMSNISKWESKVILWGLPALTYHSPVLNLAEISLTIKFGKVFQALAKQNFEYCIIFEDDVILCDNFDVKFNEYMKQTPSDWDAIYFGSCANLHPKNAVSNQIAYLKNHPSSRGGDSTVFKKKTIVDLASSWFPFNLISDWELGAQHAFHEHKVYWWEPSLVVQGSENGKFKSELR
jgi:hypothetical protein